MHEGPEGALLRGVICGVVGWLVYAVLAFIVPVAWASATRRWAGSWRCPWAISVGVAIVGFVAAYLVSGVVAVVGLATRQLSLRSHIAWAVHRRRCAGGPRGAVHRRLAARTVRGRLSCAMADRRMLRWLTAGESHGPALVAVLEGLPAGVRVTSRDVGRRWRGGGSGTGEAHG